MIYNPNNPLTDEQLDELGKTNFDLVLEYLDSQSEYLQKFAKPLGTYHTKRFATLSAVDQGKEITDEVIKRAEKIGKENEKKEYEKDKERLEEFQKNDPKYKDEGIKNIKTHRSQWFD